MTTTHSALPPSPEVADLPVRQRDWARSGLARAPEEQVRATLEEMVLHPGYPCLGARSVFRREGLRHVVFDDLDDPAVVPVLVDHLAAFEREAGQSATFSVAYLARAVSPGRYTHPAAHIEDMYRPDRFGRTAFGTAEIAPARP